MHRASLHMHTHTQSPAHQAFEEAPASARSARSVSSTPAGQARMATAMWLCQGLILPRSDRRGAERASSSDSSGTQEQRVALRLRELKLALGVMGVGAGLLTVAKHIDNDTHVSALLLNDVQVR